VTNKRIELAQFLLKFSHFTQKHLALSVLHAFEFLQQKNDGIENRFLISK